MNSKIAASNHALEGHDPICPRSDIDAAWNGADCACSIIRAARGIPDLDLLMPTVDILERIEREISEHPMGQHDPLCPPGLKSVTPDMCTWCITITQARTEGPLT